MYGLLFLIAFQIVLIFDIAPLNVVGQKIEEAPPRPSSDDEGMEVEEEEESGGDADEQAVYERFMHLMREKK